MLDPQSTTSIISQSTEIFLGLIALLLSNIGFWIREAQKARSYKTKNGNLEQIKTDISTTKKKIECVDKKLGQVREDIVEIKTEIKSIKSNCHQTVSRLTSEIQDNREKIFEIAAKKSRSKRSRRSSAINNDDD